MTPEEYRIAHRGYQRTWRKKNVKQVRAYERAWKKARSGAQMDVERQARRARYGRIRLSAAEWIKAAVLNARYRAKLRGFDFDLTTKDLTIPSVCPVLGIKIVLGGGPACPHSPSLDRVDNAMGYTTDNVRIISRRANTLKNDATVEELEKIVAYIKAETAKKAILP